MKKEYSIHIKVHAGMTQFYFIYINNVMSVIEFYTSEGEIQ